MKEIVFATNNKHKLSEIRDIMDGRFKILSLADVGFQGDIVEDADTIKGNALIKASFIAERFNTNCFADDTGLEVEALDGAPGVYSARYAGEGCSYQDNVNKLLMAMDGKNDRRAAFKTVIALCLDGNTYYFEGRIDGVITTEARGNNGFGYDPIFLPNGYDLTFAEMTEELKNKISHRALATQGLIDFLSGYGR